MSVLKYYNNTTISWEPACLGAIGATGVAGPKGATGLTGATGAAATLSGQIAPTSDYDVRFNKFRLENFWYTKLNIRIG
jgi:hypothetical protein